MMGSSSCILLGASATVHPRNGLPHISCTSLSLISATFPPAASWITHSCGAPPPLLSSPVQQEKDDAEKLPRTDAGKHASVSPAGLRVRSTVLRLLNRLAVGAHSKSSAGRSADSMVFQRLSALPVSGVVPSASVMYSRREPSTLHATTPASASVKSSRAHHSNDSPDGRGGSRVGW